MDGMKALKDLLIDGTSVRELPASIGKLFQLQILSATNCFSLVRVPGFVCDFRISLSVLALDDAKILELPSQLETCGDLDTCFEGLSWAKKASRIHWYKGVLIRRVGYFRYGYFKIARFD